MRKHAFIFLFTLSCTFTFAQAVQRFKPDRKIEHPKWNKPHVPQESSGALWRVDHTFRSNLRIKNILETDPITVTPVLFMADGTEYILGPVSLEKEGVATVNINDVLAKAPPEIQSHLSDYGSAAIRYQWPWDAVNVTVENLDLPRSLVFNFSMAPQFSANDKMPTKDTSPQTQHIDAMWWKYDENVDGLAALVNVSGQSVPVTVQLSASQGQASSAITLEIPPHSTSSISLTKSFPEIISKFREGALRVSYTGSPRQVIFNFGMEDASRGYSAKMPYIYQQVDKTSKLLTHTIGSVGIMTGVPDPMMKFPANVTFIPYGIVQNMGDRELNLTPAISYMNDQSPVYMQLPKLHLAARETRRLDMFAMLQNTGYKSSTGSSTSP